MAVEFSRDLELIQRGATAQLLLDAQKILCAECIETVMRRIDHATSTGDLTPEAAIAFVSEIAAYRRIIMRQEAIVKQGRAIQHRQETMNG